MRSLIKYLISVIAAMTVVSCTDYLDVKPQGQVIPETDLEFSAILHSQLNTIETGDDDAVIGNGISILMYECFTDNLDANLTSFAAANGNIPLYVGDELSTLETKYRSLYTVIKDCNILIDELQHRDTPLANTVTAAAVGMKSICYYDLMRDFCEPYDPANAKNQLGLAIADVFDMEAKIARSDLQATAEYIIKTMKRAIDLNLEDENYIFTREVIEAYLAKMYFWIQDWDNAIIYAEKIMADPRNELLSGQAYIDMIQAQKEKLGNVIIRSYINSNGIIADDAYKNAKAHSRDKPASKEMVELFKEKERDVRYKISFDSKRLNIKNVCARVRSDEMCLMLAECYAHKGETTKALEMLNLLRSKRITDNVDYTEATLPEVDPNAMIKTDVTGRPLTKLMSAIFDERRKELYMEGDRWYELKRNGRPEMWAINDEGFKFTTKKYLYTAPIYKRDIDLYDALIQNEGYIY